MKLTGHFLFVTLLLVSLLAGNRLAGQEDVADIVSQDLRAGNSTVRLYFLGLKPRGLTPGSGRGGGNFLVRSYQ